MLKEAFALHTQGKFAEAEHAYAELLRREPKNFQALHLMGVLALQRQETARAIELMHQSLKLEPRQPLVHRDLGNALLQAGRFTEAVASYDRALALKSDLADVHNNRGIALNALREPGKALESYNRAIALKPDYTQAYNNRGTVLMDQNRAADAVTDFTKAVALDPGYIKALNNRGQALVRLRRLEEALADHDRAIALAPNDAESHAMRGTALVAQGRGEEALKSYDRAIALAPALAVAHDGRGTALTILKRPREGLESHERAIALDDGVSTYHNNRGSALATLDRKQDSDAASHADAVIHDEWRQEALKSFDRALALNPDSAQAHYNKANVLGDMKRYDEALESHARAITLDPNFTDAHFARSILLLTLGRFEEGWAAYEWRRKRVDPDTFHPAGRPEWSGREDIAGKTLFIEVEQALGDMVQVCRYAKLAADKGARVIMTAMDHQVRLLKDLDPRVEVRPKAQRPEAFDYYIALMSLPARLRGEVGQHSRSGALSSRRARKNCPVARPNRRARIQDRRCLAGRGQRSVALLSAFPARRHRGASRRAADQPAERRWQRTTRPPSARHERRKSGRGF